MYLMLPWPTGNKVNTETYTYLLDNPQHIRDEHLDGLQGVIEAYPYFQSARALQLKALNEERRNGSHEAILEIQKEKPRAEVFGRSWINALQRATTSFKPNNATFSDIKSSGNLSIIQDKAITGALNTYYTNVAGYAETIIKNSDLVVDRVKSLDSWFEAGVHHVNIFSRYNNEIFTEAIREKIKEDLPEYISESYKPILYDAILITATNNRRRQQLLELIENEVDQIQQLLQDKCNNND